MVFVMVLGSLRISNPLIYMRLKLHLMFEWNDGSQRRRWCRLAAIFAVTRGPQVKSVEADLSAHVLRFGLNYRS